MSSDDGDDAARPAPDAPDTRARPDRHAEALRANLKRRKAQARARGEAGRDVLRPDPSGRGD